MSIHNMIHVELRCPRCGKVSGMEVEGFVGYGGLLDYKIGDRIVWTERKSPKYGGRPEGGTVDAEGYVLCPLCCRDFFVTVGVEGDVSGPR